jgi:hypothetical protein
MKILAANAIVDDMAARRRDSHPDETWTRDVPMEVQRRLFPEVTGIAHESDAGRGAVAMDLYGMVPFGLSKSIVDEVVISVKSQVKARRKASTASLTAGTMAHVTNIAKALMDSTTAYPVVYVAQDTRDGQWRQTFFDAGEVLRAVAKLDKYKGNTPIPGVSWASGIRGVPVVLRETGRKGTENIYFQLNFNLGVLVTPKGVRVPRMPGVYGLGLAEPWREVDYPEIQWEKR